MQKKTFLFIDNEIISITGEISNLEGFSYSGSKTHELFLNFQKIFNPLFRELGEYSRKLQAVPDSDPTKQALFAEYTSQLNKIKESIASFLKENSTSPIGAFMLLVTSELEEDIQKLKSQYDQLAAEVKNSFYGKILLSQINDALVGSIGSPAPDFTQEDTSGNAVALNSFKGKYVLIDFWASWCGPCRQENPNVVQAFNRFKNKNFTVLGISLDRDKNAWLEAIKEDQLWWTQLSDLKFWSNAVAVQYRVQSIPQNYLIDPDGIIIAKDLRGRELQSKLCELFGCD